MSSTTNTGERVAQIVAACSARRTAIRAIAADVRELLRAGHLVSVNPQETGDVGANIMLAYRHLEDASMRLGKAIQAADGGASVYDRQTTVGA